VIETSKRIENDQHQPAGLKKAWKQLVGTELPTIASIGNHCDRHIQLARVLIRGYQPGHYPSEAKLKGKIAKSYNIDYTAIDALKAGDFLALVELEAQEKTTGNSDDSQQRPAYPRRFYKAQGVTDDALDNAVKDGRVTPRGKRPKVYPFDQCKAQWGWLEEKDSSA
jgi:hypothetical protein